MELARILLVLTALAVIGNEATPFRFPLRIPTSFSSWLPFTFNITKDNTDLGSITLNIKPRLGGDIQTTKIKREVPVGVKRFDEKIGRLNSKESRLFGPLTERWELGIPSGASLSAGSIASMAGLIWTLVAKNIKYKKEHGELGGKDQKDGGRTKETVHIAPPASSYGSYNVPSYGSDYSLPPHKKPEKGIDGFFKGYKGIKEMQAQAMKGLSRLVGLKDLNKVLHPGQKPKKLKIKKRPEQQQQYYDQPVYQSSYTPQEYLPQPQYDPSSVYAPPPEPPAYAVPVYAPEPAPVYAPEPAPVYAPAPEPAPVYAPEPATVYAPAPEPATVYAPAPEPAPVYAPAPAPAPVYAPAPAPAPVYAPAPAPAPTYAREQDPVYIPAPVYAPPTVDATAEMNVLATPPHEPPAQYSPTNSFPNTVPTFTPFLREILSQSKAQTWNETPHLAHQPDVSSLELEQPASDPASVPVALFHFSPTQTPPTFISIQTNGFLPIYPSPVDPLPFMPSANHEETAQWPKSAGDEPSFGVPPLSSPSSPLPSRSARIEDSEPLDPSLSVTEVSNSKVSGPLVDTEVDELTQSEAEDSLVPS
ncbi:proline-rich extensin-like protein EPR1 [Daphnia magna]|uniref:proline-rich extensin-like protein EPR1 n=1 Tax=Daphnia magna TaxID=35525 RepID=UPI001E1BA1D2|nr:proline-rich extensin-like protein EPR1 [Daphnia magna]